MAKRERRENGTPPQLKSHYGNWKVIGGPTLYKSKCALSKTGYADRWMVRVECKCGYRSGIDYNILKGGKTIQCVKCSGKSHAKRYQAFGEVKTLHEWAKDPRCTIHPQAALRRIKAYGDDFETAMSRPRMNQHLRKLTDEQVRSIRDEISKGRTLRSIASQYGVAASTIYRLGKDTYRSVK